MKTRKIVQAVIVVALSAAVVAPALSAEGNLINLKKVKARIIAAQNLVVGGKLDVGLAALQEAQVQAVTADLAARVEFVGKLAEVRMAQKLGDQAKAVATLRDAFRRAKQPDQVEAVWRTGLAVAQATVARKGSATEMIDFLAKGPGPAMKQFAAHIDLARLRIATGNVGAAEAELRNAAVRATSQRDWSRWVAVVSQLAVAVDGRQSPQAGVDVFTRMREAARPVVAAVDTRRLKEYIVQPGHTLWSVMSKFGCNPRDKGQMQTWLDANPKTKNDHKHWLYSGDSLIVPIMTQCGRKTAKER